MAAIGERVAPVDLTNAIARGRLRASLIPDLLIDARRVVNTVIAGWHGRRKRGIGENFWQFRPYVEGEAMARIDWRRSARDEHVYVRDREWETSHTVWLWADPSASMLFRSTTAAVSKESRALVLILALAELLSRSGERIGYPGVTDPIASRNGAERLAAGLSNVSQPLAEPPLASVKRSAEIVIVSDFLQPVEELEQFFAKISQRGARAHLIEVADPAEEEFPYSGRTEFSDPETGRRLTAGRAEALRTEYAAAYQARRDFIRRHAERSGWSFFVNRTDRLASEALLAVHRRMSESGDYHFGGAI
jgi:uncharacterized protein (DUF58 family)